MSEQQIQRTWFTEGVLLAGMSAYAYLLAFLYEYGYCAHFEVPATLISPSLSTTLVAAAALGAALFPALNLLAFTTPLFKAARDPARRPYRYVYAFSAVLSVAGILLGAIYGYSHRGAAIYVLVALLIILILFLPAILSNRHLSLKQRFEEHADIQDKDPFVVTNLLDPWMNRKQLLLLVLGMLGLGLSLLVGDAEATRRVKYLTLKSEPDIAILRNYGDLLIGAKFNSQTRETTGELRLLWMSDKKDVSLLLAEIGPLKPKPTATRRPARPPASAARQPASSP